MKFIMNITQEIIDKGECGNLSKCAFALAYNELVPNVSVASHIVFGRSSDYIGCIEAVPLTSAQLRFIGDFDNGKKCSPKSFEVEIPDQVIDYYYGDAVKAAQHIANSKILIPLESELVEV